MKYIIFLLLITTSLFSLDFSLKGDLNNSAQNSSSFSLNNSLGNSSSFSLNNSLGNSSSFSLNNTLKNPQKNSLDNHFNNSVEQLNFEKEKRFEDNFSPEGYQAFRFFAIAIGTVPLTYLVSSLSYDIYYAVEEQKNPNFRENLTLQDLDLRNITQISVAFSLSVLIATIDLIIDMVQKNKKK